MIEYIPFIPKNSDALITSNGDNFYVPFETGGTVKIILYKNSAENNRVDKTQYLTEVSELWGTFRDESSVSNLSFVIQYETPDFNYIYVKQLNRYYYITDISFIRNGLWQIDCHVDVLMTYKENIRNTQAFVTRNEFTYNADILDNSFPTECGYNYQTIQGIVPIFEDIDVDKSICCVISGLCAKTITGG